MKHIYILLLSFSLSFASFDKIDSFDAEFIQSVTDDKGKTLTYKGHISASKPQNALWSYKEPIQKDVFINSHQVTIVEPEIEQVIIRSIDSSFDFFNMIKNAKEIKKGVYEARYESKIFTITTNEAIIESISYLDEFENRVKILFLNQVQNKEIDKKIFTPKYPLDFDVIRD
ncbi:MAG: LolA-like outer membrane lipoprotein chaperone [Sulfurimonas sp.]|nr:LolA-like outer membrane lipoprotein chaperone [Sulfurimonas sp.]